MITGPDPNTISPKFFNQIAQMAHTGMTYSLSFTAAIKFGWTGLIVAAAGVVLYAAWHEFWYDPQYENEATRGSDLEDFCFLCLGPGLAALAYWL
jgi:hypothetical protein